MRRVSSLELARSRVDLTGTAGFLVADARGSGRGPDVRRIAGGPGRAVGPLQPSRLAPSPRPRGRDQGDRRADEGDRTPARTRRDQGLRVAMPETAPQHLRVLIASERRDRLELLAQVVVGLGHDVIAREIYIKEVGQ